MKNKLQIGKTYEVMETRKNENYGPLVYIRNNSSVGQHMFAKAEKPTKYIVQIEESVQPDVTKTQRRLTGQLEQVFVSDVIIQELTDSLDIRELRNEIREKKDRFKLIMEAVQSP